MPIHAWYVNALFSAWQATDGGPALRSSPKAQ